MKLIRWCIIRYGDIRVKDIKLIYIFFALKLIHSEIKNRTGVLKILIWDVGESKLMVRLTKTIKIS